MGRTTERQYFDFNGWRYIQSDDGYWKANRDKRGNPPQWTLHRAVWEHHNGTLPRGHDVVHVDGDRTNNTPANLVAQPRKRHPHAPRKDIKRKYQTFAGTRYYLREDGYYHAPRTRAQSTGHWLMH